MSELHLQQSTLTPRIKPQPNITLPFYYASSSDGTDENLLILLHGLGDTHTPFAKLGKSLKLPQTAILALRAPQQIPFLEDGAYQWFSSFDLLGDLIENPNPTPALRYLEQVTNHLTKDCAWPLNRIHFLGYAQGGSVAAETVIERWKAQLLPQSSNKDRSPLSSPTFGSIVTISGPLLSYPTLSSLCSTPVLFAHHGSSRASSISVFHKAFSSVSDSKLITSADQSMPSSKEEWEPIMRFWSEKLSKRQEGTYEVIG